MEIKFVQYLRPDGRKREVACDIPDDLEPNYKAIKAAGLEIACEELMTGMVSITVSHEDGDFLMELGPNGPGPHSPKNNLQKVIRDFDRAKFDEWLREIQS